MSKTCTGTNREKENCDVEKYGCEGCSYYKEKGGNNNEQKTSECTNRKSN